MSWQDVQRIAVAQEYEQGYRIGCMLFGDGENGSELNVRVASIRARAVAAVGDA